MLPRLIVLFLQRQFTVSEFCSRLSFWKGGINLLDQECAEFHPLYYMSTFLKPKGVAKVLTSTQRKFLRAGVSKQYERYTGRQGIGSLMGKNKTMLFK